MTPWLAILAAALAVNPGEATFTKLDGKTIVGDRRRVGWQRDLGEDGRGRSNALDRTPCSTRRGRATPCRPRSIARWN